MQDAKGLRRPFWILAVIALCLSAALAARQSDPQATPVFRTRVDVIVLDVSVLDKDRKPVRGLTAADFTVIEDGKPQKVTMFSAVDIPEPEEPPAPWMKDVVSDVRSNEDDASSQVIVILLDDANPMAPDALTRAREQARSIVERLGPRDIAAVAFVADARSGQEFTHDRQRLLAAIDRFNGPAESKGGIAGALEMLGPSYTLNSLKGQAEALQELPAARKAVIFISTRGAALPDSLTGTGDAEGQEAPPGLDAAGMAVENFGQFGGFVRAAQRSNLNVYCLDPGGLRPPEVVSTPFGPTTTRMVANPNSTGAASLQALATSTGGFAIVHTNDPQPGLTQVFRENRSYYLLAYASSNSRTDGRYRRVQVRVNRPDVTVRTRNGYFEAEQLRKKSAATPAPLNVALSGVVPRSDLPLELAAAPFRIPGKRQAAVAITAGVRHSAPAANARFASFDVSVNAYDYLAKRRASDTFRTRVALRPGPDEEAEFELLSRLDLPPGRYQLRLAASQTREWNTLPPGTAGWAAKTGSVFVDLDVPDFANAPLSLSGLVMSLTPPRPYGPQGRLNAVIPVVPTTLRQFIRADAVTAFVRVYQGGKAAVVPVDVNARIVDAANHGVVDETQVFSAERFGRDRAADVTYTLPMQGLERGEYLLTLTATAGKQVVRRDVRFVVR